MRRSQEHESAQLPRPMVACRGAVVVGTPGHQSSHAVADDRQFLYRYRPLLEKRLDQVSKLTPIFGDVQTGVVAQIQRRVAELTGQRRSMVVSFPLPLQVVQAKTVCQQEHLAGGLR